MRRVEFKFAEMPLLREFFRDILTGRDGKSYDAGRAMGLFGGVSFILFGFAQLAMGVYDLVENKKYTEFPFIAFGTGFGLMASGIGVLLKLKENTEPPAGGAA